MRQFARNYLLATLLAVLTATAATAKPYLYVKGDYNMTLWSWGNGTYEAYHLYGDGTLHNNGWESWSLNRLMERGNINGEWWYRVDLARWSSAYGPLNVSMRHYKDGAHEATAFTVGDCSQNAYAVYDYASNNAYLTSDPTGGAGDAAFQSYTLGQPYLLSTVDNYWSKAERTEDAFEYVNSTTWRKELPAQAEVWFRIWEKGNSVQLSAPAGGQDIGNGESVEASRWEDSEDCWHVAADPAATRTYLLISREIGGGDGLQTNPVISLVREHGSGTASAYEFQILKPGSTTEVLASYPFQNIRSRATGKAMVYTDLVFNIKNDEIRKLLRANGYGSETQISYRVRENSGTTYLMYSGSAGFELGLSSSLTKGTLFLNTANTGNTEMARYDGVTHDTYEGCPTAGVPFVLTLDAENIGSYTWFFHVESHDLEIYKNPRMDYKKSGGSYQQLQEQNFYLIGNLRNVDPENNNWEADKSRPMKRTVYPLTWKEGDDIALIDSIVYTQTILRPENGYGNLYIAAAPESAFGEGLDGPPSLGGTSWTGWNHIIRPQVPLDHDAVALEGGVFTFGDTDNEDKGQALNPVGADQYESYTFSFNLTTATYRLIMNEDLYIMGPAVAAAGTTAGAPTESEGWSTANPSQDTDHAFKLTLDSKHQCYVFADGTDSEGNPVAAKLHFFNGQKFRFATNKRMSLTNYGEDQTVPLDLSGKTATYPYTAVYDQDDDSKLAETQYVNKVQTFVYDVDSHDLLDTEQQKADLTFLLPTGDYTLRLYNIVRTDEFGNPDEADIYYTLDRAFALTAVPATVENPLGYAYYRSFSDWHAFHKPEGVDVLIVTATDADSKTATVKRLDTDYIPAQTGVILASNSLAKPTFVHYTDPNRRLEGESNCLQPAIYDQEVPAEAGGGRYNYVFGYRALSSLGETTPKTGFFKSAGGNSGRNNSFLQIGDLLSGSAKGFTLTLDSDSRTTAIGSPAQDDGQEAAGSVYDLQGRRVRTAGNGLQGLRPGIYTVNGKKLMVK